MKILFKGVGEMIGKTIEIILIGILVLFWLFFVVSCFVEMRRVDKIDGRWHKL